jgi:hypothetical protein
MGQRVSKILFRFFKWYAFVFLGLLLLILVMGPLKTIEKLLVLNGHKASGFKLDFGLDNRFGLKENLTLSVERLGLVDQNKTLEIENLIISVPFTALLEKALPKVILSAGKIVFVDETKPNESLQYFLAKFPGRKAVEEDERDKAEGASSCLGSVKVELLSFAVSHSASPWIVRDLNIERPCLFERKLTFSALSLDSEDIQVSSSSVKLKINKDRFHDVENGQALIFNKQESSIDFGHPELGGDH